MEQTYMKEKPILPLLMKLAIPMMLSMLINSLYNIIDSIFVAKISENAITAISLVYPIQNVINSIAVGFGVGINAVVAFYLGAGEKKKSDDAASQGLLISILHGIIVIIVGFMIMPKFLEMFTENKEVIQLGLKYSYIVIAFSIVIMIQITFEKIFQAMGMMKVSMISMGVGCIVNIILDPIMIFIMDMGIEGAALATGISQLISMIIYIGVFKIKSTSVEINLKNIKFEKKLIKKLYAIGIPASLNMALPSLLVSVLNSILAGFSEVYVLVLGIYYKLQTFIYLPANGIIQGMRPIISYNYGAGEKERVKKIYEISVLVIGSLMFVGTILCLLMPQHLTSMFTSNEETIKIGITALRIICIGFLFSAVSVTAAGALEALGKGWQSMIISLLRYAIVIIPLAMFLSNVFGVDGVWHSFWITEVLICIIAHKIYNKQL